MQVDEQPCFFNEGQQEGYIFNQNPCINKLNYQNQYSTSINSNSSTQQRKNQYSQNTYQSQYHGSCNQQTFNPYISSDNNYMQLSNSQYQSDIHFNSNECVQNFQNNQQQQQQQNEIYTYQQLQKNNNQHKKINYCLVNDANCQQNTNQSYYQLISNTNQEEQQIQNENQQQQTNHNSILHHQESSCPLSNQNALIEENNGMEKEVLHSQQKKLSPTQIRAIQKNKKAYCDQYTCKACNYSYAGHSGISNHVKKFHPGFKTSDLQKKPNTTKGRTLKFRINSSHQNDKTKL
ncbi:hypothetical protein ABPG72_009685 [Tetrahymena utriculariae]